MSVAPFYGTPFAPDFDAQEREHCRLDLVRLDPGAFVARWGRQLEAFLLDPYSETQAEELEAATEELKAATEELERARDNVDDFLTEIDNALFVLQLPKATLAKIVEPIERLGLLVLEDQNTDAATREAGRIGKGPAASPEQ